MTLQLPVRFYEGFIKILSAEIGPETLNLLLEKAGLPAEQAQPGPASHFDAASSARNFSSAVRALRAYYGRGVRGTLLRVGRLLFHHLLQNASFAEKTRAGLIKALPVTGLRRKQSLELAAGFMRMTDVDVTTHSLDLDLLVVDHVSPAAAGLSENASICFVTQGFLQEALFWATGQEHDVEEIHCRAAGHETCEFKISLPQQ